MDLNAVGRLVIFFGIVLVVIGGALILFSRLPFLKNLGNLPGDIQVRGENYACFLPIVSMIVLSVLLSLALNIIIRLFNR